MAFSIDTTQYIDKMLRFCKSQGLNINLLNPQTIQDKLCWLNIYDTDPLKVKCADKIQLHDYCKEVLGKDICIPIIKIYDNVNQIIWDELPEQFVMKCNHGSGMNIICKDKSTLDKEKAIRDLSCWMDDDFAFRNGFEAHYHDIPRKIFVEVLKGNGNLYDYKFWCFNGEPKFYSINDGHGHGPIVHYKMSQTQMSLEREDYPFKGVIYQQPQNFDAMVMFAKRLSKPFKFVRVDFYEIDGVLYLGELTFTPGAMGFRYKNEVDNTKIGNMLQI